MCSPWHSQHCTSCSRYETFDSIVFQCYNSILNQITHVSTIKENRIAVSHHVHYLAHNVCIGVNRFSCVLLTILSSQGTIIAVIQREWNNSPGVLLKNFEKSIAIFPNAVCDFGIS